MTTAELSIRMTIPHYGDGPMDLIAPYTYYPRTQQVEIHTVTTDIHGTEVVVWHHLTQQQRGQIEDECIADYYARRDSVIEERRRTREYDAWV